MDLTPTGVGYQGYKIVNKTGCYVEEKAVRHCGKFFSVYNVRESISSLFTAPTARPHLSTFD